MGDRAKAAAAVIGDWVFAALIAISAAAAWAPHLGIAAAREQVAARRVRRAAIAGIVRTQGPVWARQASRNALGRQRSQIALRCGRPAEP